MFAALRLSKSRTVMYWSRRRRTPITNLALMKLTQGKDVSGAYMTKMSRWQNHTRSMTTIIRNPQQKAIGLLCINAPTSCAIPRGDAFTRSLFASALRKTSNHAKEPLLAVMKR
ncbi:PAS domain-containing protein [Vibrio lentus]|nr:PAS domain-containing protein [Vibrio lentus]